ncbi:hypothetical protein TcasGA2_TC008053 [Tribolium castaneum]|uniref:Uncharacterized protein n=1 Tax=Tribolium castaneum TaxID=7070 RepID=D1ZZJ0_TRICA|nr:hypothetical protein TcasGA2_TC008053 [Tribolium castaneum]
MLSNRILLDKLCFESGQLVATHAASGCAEGPTCPSPHLASGPFRYVRRRGFRVRFRQWRTNKKVAVNGHTPTHLNVIRTQVDEVAAHKHRKDDAYGPETGLTSVAAATSATGRLRRSSMASLGQSVALLGKRYTWTTSAPLNISSDTEAARRGATAGATVARRTDDRRSQHRLFMNGRQPS